MTAMYESSTYNILSVYKAPAKSVWDEGSNAYIDYDEYYCIVIQRLPTTTYPETTEVYLPVFENDTELSVNDWLTQSLPSINAEIARYDVEFNNSPYLASNVNLFTQLFNQ